MNKWRKQKKDIDDRVAARDVKEYNTQDIKDLISASLNARFSEMTREKKLQMGGGDAARILAMDRNNQTTLVGDESIEPPSIKPGEASLVAPFSCLHPSIDGVDAILRAGIATAASALSSKTNIALYSLLSGFHLVTLYSDGFKYGRNMWPIELLLMANIQIHSQATSAISRPRLPPSFRHRPPSSIFDPSAFFPTLFQAVTHLMSMAVAANIGSKLECKDVQKATSRIRLDSAPNSPKIRKVLETLVARDWCLAADEEEPRSRGLLARPPYRPNFESDAVFIFSILQRALVACVQSHQGKQFHRSILESRLLCSTLILNFLLVLGLALESFPELNRMIEMREMDSLQDKVKLLGVAALNVLACIGFQGVFDIFNPNIWKDIPLKKGKKR